MRSASNYTPTNQLIISMHLPPPTQIFLTRNKDETYCTHAKDTKSVGMGGVMERGRCQ